jgi:hypothetical protein
VAALAGVGALGAYNALVTSLTRLFDLFAYDLPARCSGRFISPVWDTGSQSHGVAILPHTQTYGLAGEMVELVLEPLRPLRPDELATLPRVPTPVCAASAGNESLPGPYSGQHFLFLPQQLPVATVGRCADIEMYTGWLCRVGLGKVALQRLDGRMFAGL